MDKVIFFDNKNQTEDLCTGVVYYDFIDYAFSKSDFFMLVYVNYSGKGLSKKQRYFKERLAPFVVKSRSDARWPGTIRKSFNKRDKTTYKVIFYKIAPEAKDILKEVDRLSDWSPTGYPEDLAFFKGEQCWMYSVGHEKIAAIVKADNEDIDFLASRGLAKKEDAFEDSFYDSYNEKGLSLK